MRTIPVPSRVVNVRHDQPVIGLRAQHLSVCRQHVDLMGHRVERGTSLFLAPFLSGRAMLRMPRGEQMLVDDARGDLCIDR